MTRCWQRRAAEVACVRRGQRLPCARQTLFQPAPVDLLQDVAEPTSQAGRAPGKAHVTTHLRKKHCAAAARERTEKKL